MRLFIGIKASTELQKKIEAWQREHRELLVRWIKPENLHITLVPPGKEEEIRRVFGEMKASGMRRRRIVFENIEIRFDSRVIWVGKPGEHITIARFKDPAPLRGMRFEPVHWEEMVDNITLFQSVTGPVESTYIALEVYTIASS